MRRVLYGLGAVVAVVSVAGCAKITAAFQVKSNNTVSGTAVIAVQKQYAKGLNKNSFSGLPSSAKVVPYNQGGYIGEKATFQGVSLSFMNQNKGSSSGPSVVLLRQGKDFILTLPAQKTSASQSGGTGAVAMLEAEIQLTYTFTFPGKVISSSGPVQVKGNTASIDIQDLVKSQTIRVVAAS
jgi:hypothetical protein